MQNNSHVEIDINEIFSVLWLNKTLVTFIVIISSITSVIIALRMPNIYQSSALLVVNSSNSSNSSITSQFGSLGALAGLNVQSDGQDKATLAINTIKSRDFFNKLIKDDIVLAKLMASISYNSSSKEVIYDNKIYDAKNNKWLKSKPSRLQAHKKYIGSTLKASKDRKTNYISLSIDHVSPFFAEQFLQSIITSLNDSIKKSDLEESIAATDYLSGRLAETSVLEVKKSLNNLIESQLKTQMLANIQDDYILKSIDPPFIPEEKYLPQRSMVCITGFLIGLFFAIFIVLIRHYFFLSKNKS